jgi:hypothetical protein
LIWQHYEVISKASKESKNQSAASLYLKQSKLSYRKLFCL